MDQLSVFISYSHRDKQIARSLARALKKQGLHVWIDEGELRTGDSIISRIASAIDEVEYIVALVSANSVSSVWCKKEIALAVNRGLKQGRVRILPLRLDDVEMPPSLQDVMYLQIDSSNPTQVVKRLIRDVRRHHQENIEQQTSLYSLRFKPLATKSAFSSQQLKRMLRELTQADPTDYHVLNRAMKSLMKDYSIPAIDTLYEATLKDAGAKLNLGYGIAGIMYLAPVTAPWIRQLLMNRNQSLVKMALKYLSNSDYVRADVLEDTLRAIERLEKWSEFKKVLLSKVAGWHNADWFTGVIDQIDQTGKRNAVTR
jgi:hypothetical protein